MAQSEQYEVWIWGADRWTLKSSWRDLEVGLAAASAHNGPVRIIRVLYEDDAVVEKSVIAELRAPPKDGRETHVTALNVPTSNKLR